MGLKPIGNTLEQIKEKHFLEKDEHRANSYKRVKNIIDEYYKDYIEKRLSDFSHSHHSDTDSSWNKLLKEYNGLYHSKRAENTEKSRFAEIQQTLRKEISKALNDKAQSLSGKELIQKDLISFLKTRKDLSKDEINDRLIPLVNEFEKFSTYFTGFSQNRENIFSSKEKSSSASYRLINENLPKFIDNMGTYGKLHSIPEISEMQDKLYEAFKKQIHYLKLGISSIDEMFQLEYFNNVLTQSQIDLYNAIIGGKTEGDLHIDGINQYVNRYNQTHKDERLPKLKTLFKQILSDRASLSAIPEKIENDDQAVKAVTGIYETIEQQVLAEDKLKNMLVSLSDYNLEGIFISNGQQLTQISKNMLGRREFISDAIVKCYQKSLPQKKRENYEDYLNRIRNNVRSIGSFSIADINQYIAKQPNGKDDYPKENPSTTIQDYFAKLDASDHTADIFSRISKAHQALLPALGKQNTGNISSFKDKNTLLLIKNLLDAILDLVHFVKPLLGTGDEIGKDERFYGDFSPLWNELKKFMSVYDMIRNYATQKPYKKDKIKINFENVQLLQGWDQNKEKEYASIILRRDGKYYLAIMDKDSKKLLGKAMPSDGDCYEKMVYKFIPDAKKMFPKVFLSKKGQETFKPTPLLIDNYNRGTHKKGKNFNLKDCHDLIDYFKHSIGMHEDWGKFGFNFSDTSSYEDISEFYNEVNQQSYKLTFTKVSVHFIDKLVDEGKMYMFQIYNKDFSEYSKGTPNIHTLYWKALFDERNLADVVYKLNGKAELFYRKKSIGHTHPTHPANQPIKNKSKDNEKAESTFGYDLIKDRRYTVDMFQFHVPITMNFKCGEKEKINLQVAEYLHTADDIHIIGVDRGERNLLYLVVIDIHGNIKEQFTLNDIVNEHNGNTYHTNYHDLLGEREEERIKARQSWQAIENIKELKEGYLSQVIHKITQLMMKYHAIVVLEDLNFGFKRSRQKVEKSVYQKFEKQLINKLQFLVNKQQSDPQAPGGVFNAYQLADKFESFQKLGKQSGFIFYIPAWNTSNIDPVTGFVNLFDTHYANVEKSKEFFKKFDTIRYNAEKDWFEFSFDYNHFTKKAEGSRTNWTLYTYGTRIKTFRNDKRNNEWDNEEMNLTDSFKTFFADNYVDINSNLQEAITNQNDKGFFVKLFELFKLLLQMRNSKIKSDVDFLLSPVADENGVFFDSRKYKGSRKCSGVVLPENADANGAFNIARKGLMLVRQMRIAKDEPFKPDLSNRQWLKFAQDKPYLND